MEEQKELDELKRLMTEQQSKLANTMAEMEMKASTLQEKLDKKSELSKSNAKAGVKKVALEYKVVELDMSLKVPPGFKFGEQQTTTAFTKAFGSASAFGGAAPNARPEPPLKGFPDPTSKEFEDQAVKKDMKQEARKQLREFETTTLKELGEDGWTLRSIGSIVIPGSVLAGEYTHCYYFSRPL